MCGKSIKNESIKPESDSCEKCSISRHTNGQKEKRCPIYGEMETGKA